MSIDRVSVKQQAKGIIRDSRPSLISAAIIYTVLSALISYLSLRLTGVDNETMMKIAEAAANGRTEAAMNLVTKAAPGVSETTIDLLLQLALSIVGAGFSIFILNTVRHTEASYGNLLDGFGMMPRLLFLILLERLFVMLWSMLLVVPGIIAAYRYSFAVYIMIDHPEMSAMDCIRESKRLTQGYKSQLFLLDLSFLVWWIFSALPLIGYAVQFFLTPYVWTSRILYYEQIRQKSIGREVWETM